VKGRERERKKKKRRQEKVKKMKESEGRKHPRNKLFLTALLVFACFCMCYDLYFVSFAAF